MAEDTAPTEEGAPQGGAVPSDDELRRARLRANLAKGREKAAANRKAKAEARAERAADDGDTEPKNQPPRNMVLAGCRTLVLFCWSLAAGVCWLAKGRLPKLEESEVSEGAQAALPLVQQFGWLAWLLGFLGFPLWLVDAVRTKFEPREAKPAPLQLAKGG